MPRAVRFDRYGGIEVLQVVEVPRPVPGPGRVLVRMKAAGLNPNEISIRQGLLAKRWPATFPSGEGSDLAGVVEEIGAAVQGFASGDEVIGFSNERSTHADLVVIPESQLTRRPPDVPWEQAGALYVSGTTAYAAVRAVALKPGETLVVSAAAGGVGSMAVQLAKNEDVRVIGLASPSNHEWLKAHGVIPVAHGDGIADRIRAAAGGRIDAFVDTFGHGYAALALELGVAPERIDTIVYWEAVPAGVKTAGNQDAASADVLAELAGMISAGRLQVPIAAVYPLADVCKAYSQLEQRHTRGKIVLVP